jgi:cell division septum initiation protein DivIVA
MTEDAQDQQQQIDALKAEVAALRDRVGKLEVIIQRMARENRDAFRAVQDRLPRPPLPRM